LIAFPRGQISDLFAEDSRQQILSSVFQTSSVSNRSNAFRLNSKSGNSFSQTIGQKLSKVNCFSDRSSRRKEALISKNAAGSQTYLSLLTSAPTGNGVFKAILAGLQYFEA